MSDSQPGRRDGIGPAPCTRNYRHAQCGRETRISGYDFERLANPFAAVPGTLCSPCGRIVKLRDVAWSDTSETISACRRRLRRTVPPPRRWLYAAHGTAIGLILRAIVGAGMGFLLTLGVRFRPPWQDPSIYVGALMGAMPGIIIGCQMVPPLLMRSLWGIDYRAER